MRQLILQAVMPNNCPESLDLNNYLFAAKMPPSIQSTSHRLLTKVLASMIGTFGIAEGASAACNWISTTPGVRAVNISATINVPPSTPVNSVIHTVDFPANGGATQPTIRCDGPYSYDSRGYGTQKLFRGDVYETGTPGVGVRYRSGSTTYPYSYTFNVAANAWNYHYSHYTSAGKIEFVKIGNIASGVVAGGTAGRFELHLENRLFNYITLSGALTINATQTCDFGSGVANFNLGALKTTDLGATGSATTWVNGSLPSGGCESVRNIYMSFGGTAVADNPLLYRPTAGSPAQGVGIEIQSYDGLVAQPNAAREMRWNPRSAGDSYGFKARLVRSAGALRPGQLGASITVTMRYD